MATTRTTFTLDDSLFERARALGVNVSAAARDGVEAAVQAAMVESDRRAYIAMPEESDDRWAATEAWGPSEPG